MQVKELRLIMVSKGQYSRVRDSLSEMLTVLHKSFLKNLSVLKIHIVPYALGLSFSLIHKF